MNKYISIVELGKDSTEFASIIGIRGVDIHRYICESIDAEGNRIHTQTFTLPKSIEGLPANNAALQADILKAWRSEQEKIRNAMERNIDHE